MCMNMAEYLIVEFTTGNIGEIVVVRRHSEKGLLKPFLHFPQVSQIPC